MQNQHSYNLRPRKYSHELYIRKPEIGDIVSIFWEALGKEYEGNLTKFDTVNKTFLVDYDDIPGGYDDHLIWENLDYVPWRFLGKSMQRHLRRLRLAKRHSRLRGTTDGMADGGNAPQWFEPGELSTAHPEFCEMSDRHLYRGKRKRKLKESLADVSGSSEEEDEEDMILESEGGEDEAEHGSKEEDEEQTDMFGYHPFSEDLNNPKKSAEWHGEPPEMSRRGRKRTYANFGVLDCDCLQKDSFSRATPAGQCSSHFAQDTTRVNCSRDWAIIEPSTVLGATNEPQQNSTLFQRPRNQILQYRVTDGNANNAPTVEDQVRAITKSLGIFGRNEL